MKNVHILSTSRSGSKSLERALTKVINPLTINDQPLGEYLNATCIHGAKLTTEDYIIERDLSNVIFENNPRFNEPGLYNHILYYNKQDNLLQWKLHTYVKYLTTDHIRSLIYPIQEYIKYNPYSTILLKTQLAELQYCTWNGFCLNGLRDEMLLDNCITIGLYRTDTVSWICSSYLAKLTGIYDKTIKQQNIIEQLKDNPVTIPLDFLRIQFLIAKHHIENIVSTCDIQISLDGKNSVEPTLNLLRDKLQVDIPEFEHSLEYSTVPYSSTIANYKQVCDLVKNVFPTYWG